MTKDSALKLALEALEEVKSWKSPTRWDGCFDKEITAIKEALAQPEQEPVDKNGSPCPEFWDWLPKAYNFDGDGTFTKYNMEVAFLAGKRSVAASDTSEKRVDETEKQRHEQEFGDLTAAYMTGVYDGKKQRTWVGLTDEEKILMSGYDLQYAALIGVVERALKEKNT